MVRAEVDHPGQQGVGVGQAEQGGDAVVVLLAEPVAAPAGDHVHARRGRRAAGRTPRSVSPCGRSASHAAVSARSTVMSRSPPAGLLEVRLEGLGQVAVTGVPLLDRLDQLRQPLAGVAAPVVGQGGPGRGHHLRVAGHPGQVEQADRGRQVAGRRRCGTGSTVRTLWSSRAPASQIGYQSRSASSVTSAVVEGAPVVQQDEVEVAERPGLTAGEAADRGERHALDPAAPGGLRTRCPAASPGRTW